VHSTGLLSGGVVIYLDLAYIYDRLMSDIDYCKWADYIEKIFHYNNHKPKLIVDLGCGTGSFCIEMAKRGYDTIGIDISSEMLSLAVSKSEDTEIAGDKLLFLNQDMSEFELYGTADAFVSLMDSVNYVTGKRELKSMFKLVRNYLNPGGLFIFDVNSVYKFEKVLNNNVFYYINDDITYIWANNYNKRTKICEFDLTFFVKDKSDLYKRFDEIHYERAYSVEEISRLINDNGLELIVVYDNLSFNKPLKKSERLFFVCRKP